MKKWMLLLTAALLLLSLCSCGDKQAGEPGPFATEDVYTLCDGGVFSEDLEVLDADVAYALYRLGDYGLERDSLTDATLLRSAGATCEEVAVLIFDQSADMEQVKQAMADYLADQVESNRNYRPDELPKLESALLEGRENTVLLAVCADSGAARKLLGLN